MSVIEIIFFSPELQPYFESINKAWVNKHFSLEPFDIDQWQRYTYMENWDFKK